MIFNNNTLNTFFVTMILAFSFEHAFGCTHENDDIYKTGKKIGCCSTLKEKSIKNPPHSKYTHRTICVLKSEDDKHKPSERCTDIDEDMYRTGHKIKCCEDLEEVKIKTHPGSKYTYQYLCKEKVTCTDNGKNTTATGEYLKCCDGLTLVKEPFKTGGKRYREVCKCTGDKENIFSTGRRLKCCPGHKEKVSSNPNHHKDIICEKENGCTILNENVFKTGKRMDCCSDLLESEVIKNGQTEIVCHKRSSVLKAEEEKRKEEKRKKDAETKRLTGKSGSDSSTLVSSVAMVTLANVVLRLL